MKRSVSHAEILGAILKKDLRLYSRNKIYLLLTTVSLAAFVLIFWILPDTVDETITLAISPPLQAIAEDGKEELLRMGATGVELEQMDEVALESEEEGITLVELENEAQLRRVIEGTLEVYQTDAGALILRDLEAGENKPREARLITPQIGIAFPGSFLADTARGIKTTVTVYSEAAVPEEIRQAMQSFVREIAYQVAGSEFPVEFPDEESIVLGRDRAGEQASLRDRLRPMLAFFILMMEMFAMAALISTEVLQRTVTALLVTPLRIWHFLTAKTIFGTLMALAEGLLILLLVGAFTPANWSLLLVTVLIGAVLFTAVAMIIGAAGKDFLEQIMYALLFMVPLMIPAFAVLIPGTAAAWVRAIPSYPVIDLLMGVTIYNAGWADSFGTLAYALLWVAILYGVGLFVLKRKVELL